MSGAADWERALCKQIELCTFWQQHVEWIVWFDARFCQGPHKTNQHKYVRLDASKKSKLPIDGQLAEHHRTNSPEHFACCRAMHPSLNLWRCPLTNPCSHEVGHSVGLYHDGVNSSSYYWGHGSGATSWAPIMGVSIGWHP